jgi:hypothetical protein
MHGVNEWAPTPSLGGTDNEADEGDDILTDLPALLEERKFDFTTVPTRPVPVLMLNGQTISTPGNLTNIQALPKAGKTSVIGGILAAVIGGSSPGVDTFGFTSVNPLGGGVLHFDTEQSRFDHDRNVRLALRRANVVTPPPWLPPQRRPDRRGRQPANSHGWSLHGDLGFVVIPSTAQPEPPPVELHPHVDDV